MPLRSILLVFGLFVFGTFAVAISDTTPQFLPVVSIPVGKSPRGIAVGNVLGQGREQLVVANFGAGTFIGRNTPVSLLDPQNSTVQVFSSSSSGLQLTTSFVTASGPRGLCLANIQNKDRENILVTDYDSNLLQVFGWEGTKFVKNDEKTTLNLPVGVMIGSAHKSDPFFVAVANYGSNSISLFPIKDGRLGDRVDIPVDAGPVQLAIGDLNGDGTNEIAVACLDANKVDILTLATATKQSETLSYELSKALSIPCVTPTELKIADLNRDGRLDLVVTNFSKSTVSIFYQEATGVLVAGPDLAVSGKHPHGLLVQDLYRTGNPQIVVADRDSDSIDIFESNDGAYRLSRVLRTSDEVETALGPVEVVVMDTRGIGMMDLVASHMRSDSIKVFTRILQSSSKMPQVHTAHTPDDDEKPFSDRTTICYPNPSHDGKVKLSFTLDSPQDVSIQIFNTMGNLVWSRNLLASETVVGTNVVNWNGINKNGLNLSSGIYLCRVTVGVKTVVRKVAILH